MTLGSWYQEHAHCSIENEGQTGFVRLLSLICCWQSDECEGAASTCCTWVADLMCQHLAATKGPDPIRMAVPEPASQVCVLLTACCASWHGIASGSKQLPTVLHARQHDLTLQAVLISIHVQGAMKWMHGSPVAVRRKLLFAAVEDCQLQASMISCTQIRLLKGLCKQV